MVKLRHNQIVAILETYVLVIPLVYWGFVDESITNLRDRLSPGVGELQTLVRLQRGDGGGKERKSFNHMAYKCC